MRLLYFDCIAGISGDMALGAFVDAGVDADELRRSLARLPIEPFDVTFERVEVDGIAATRASVRERTGSVGGVIRTYASIRSLIDAADLPGGAKTLAQRIFRRLAEAEGKVHARDVEHVTFHEIGAVDSIVDIVGSALAITMLAVDRVFSSAVPTGMGLVRSEHGAMPIPAPAVVELLRHAPLYSRGVPAELVTPTGAAILAATVEGFGDLPSVSIDAVGYGAGTRRLDVPNVLRVLVGEETAVGTSGDRPGSSTTGEVVLETNVDDLNPELYGFVLERLLEAGAQDAWLTPIVMKKGRAAVTISTLCSGDRAGVLRNVLFRETGTLGVRTTHVDKLALERSTIQVQTRFGSVSVKVGYLDGLPLAVAPEYEDCARAAREAAVAARTVYEEATRLGREALEQRLGPT